MEKVVSERVISQKIVSKKNSIPIIGGIMNKFNNLSEGIAGLCIAPVLILAAFGVLVYSENFSKASETVGELELIAAADVDENAGLSKIQGEPNITEFVEAPEIGDVLYYTYSMEEYREVEEKRQETTTKVVDGQEIEETVERTVLVEKWVEEESETEWSEFTLGDVEIDPDKADIEFNMEKEVFLLSVLEGYTDYPNSYSAEVGDVRITVNYVSIDDSLIVVGDISGNRISSGDTFIISNKSDAELLSDLENSENTQNMILKGIAFVLYFVGYMSIFRPLIALADFIPLVGKPASAAASVAALILAAGSVFVVTVFIKFWWLIVLAGVCIVLILLGLLAGTVIGKKVQAEAKERDELED